MALRRLTLHQLAAVPRQIAKFPDGRRRNEARAEQPMAEQVGDPFRVFDIRLTARNFPDMLRIGHHDLQSPRQWRMRSLTKTPGVWGYPSHSGTYPPPVTPLMLVLSFHTLMNCKFRNSFLLTFMDWMEGGYESVWVLSFWLSRPRLVGRPHTIRGHDL